MGITSFSAPDVCCEVTGRARVNAALHHGEHPMAELSAPKPEIRHVRGMRV